MGKIPDRWLPYRALGKIIKGTRFVAFKVPLSEKLSKGLPETERFTPDVLVATCPNLSLVIDLTNTYRYYDKWEFTSKSVHYEKISVPGRECPTSDLLQRFYEIVDKFMESEDNTDSLIGVHCTHGVNRTGYFICSYMIQRLGFDPVTALQAFKEGRGYPIERENYIKELKKCFRKKVEYAHLGNAKANSSYRTVEKTNLYRIPNTDNSHKSADTRNLYRIVQRNDSYIGSNINTSWSEKRGRDKMLLSKQACTNNKNCQKESKCKRTFQYNRGHTAPGSNYNRGYSSDNSKLNSQRGRKGGHTSHSKRDMKKPRYNKEYYGEYSSANCTRNSDISHRDQSDDWRTNNPYTQRNVGGTMTHTNYRADLH